MNPKTLRIVFFKRVRPNSPSCRSGGSSPKGTNVVGAVTVPDKPAPAAAGTCAKAT